MSDNILTTHDIIRIKESELVVKLKTMSTDELEAHAKAIMKDMGSRNYSGIMSEIMKSLKKEQQNAGNSFETVQDTLQNTLPNKAYLSDIYARLAAILMTIIARKFKELL